jgi:glutathionylspermidine synthase
MKRIIQTPRDNWQKKLEDVGFIFHTPDERYWDEEAAYQFSMNEILKIEEATNELHRICLEAVQHVIDNKLYSRFAIPPEFIPLIEKSWNSFDGDGDPSIYGRFDLSYDGNGGDPKMLEYNADTPTSLLEAAVAQWGWMEEVNDLDQFNSIHEKLIEYWNFVAPYLKEGPLYFAGLMDNREDTMTIAYLADTASQAGIRSKDD